MLSLCVIIGNPIKAITNNEGDADADTRAVIVPREPTVRIMARGEPLVPGGGSGSAEVIRGSEVVQPSIPKVNVNFRSSSANNNSKVAAGVLPEPMDSKKRIYNTRAASGAVARREG
jgi:hypothetical protein